MRVLRNEIKRNEKMGRKKKTIKWNEVLPYNFSGIFADTLNQPKFLIYPSTVSQRKKKRTHPKSIYKETSKEQ